MSNPQLRSKCLLQRIGLLMQQQQHTKALDAANEVLQISPDSKHAAAWLATAQHKVGKKKQAAATITDLCASFQRPDDAAMTDDLGYVSPFSDSPRTIVATAQLLVRAKYACPVWLDCIACLVCSFDVRALWHSSSRCAAWPHDCIVTSGPPLCFC